MSPKAAGVLLAKCQAPSCYNLLLCYLLLNLSKPTKKINLVIHTFHPPQRCWYPLKHRVEQGSSHRACVPNIRSQIKSLFFPSLNRIIPLVKLQNCGFFVVFFPTSPCFIIVGSRYISMACFSAASAVIKEFHNAKTCECAREKMSCSFMVIVDAINNTNKTRAACRLDGCFFMFAHTGAEFNLCFAFLQF